MLHEPEPGQLTNKWLRFAELAVIFKTPLLSLLHYPLGIPSLRVK